jgi:hypothetical protein
MLSVRKGRDPWWFDRGPSFSFPSPEELFWYHDILELTEIERPKTYNNADNNKFMTGRRERTKHSPETGSHLKHIAHITFVSMEP